MKDSSYPVDLAVECHDRNNLLIDILNALSSAEAKVTKVNAKFHPSNNTTTISLTLLAKNTDELGSYIHQLSLVKSVFAIHRLTH